jgi:hypothetical protein
VPDELRADCVRVRDRRRFEIELNRRGRGEESILTLEVSDYERGIDARSLGHVTHARAFVAVAREEVGRSRENRASGPLGFALGFH